MLKANPSFSVLAWEAFSTHSCPFCPLWYPAFSLTSDHSWDREETCVNLFFGVTNTNDFPHPSPAPGQPVEDVQIDVAWNVLIEAM